MTLTLDEVHNDIAAIYRWWAVKAPGVTPVEAGELGALWALADILHEEEAEARDD